MPWSAASFKSKHNKSLSPEAASKAASIANAMLKSGTPEDVAIATTNKRVAKLGKHARKKS
jgi:uncharacterized protein YdaT